MSTTYFVTPLLTVIEEPGVSVPTTDTPLNDALANLLADRPAVVPTLAMAYRLLVNLGLSPAEAADQVHFAISGRVTS